MAYNPSLIVPHLPCRIMLIGAMNPWGCSDAAVRPRACPPWTKMKYRSKISGPSLDRIDPQI
jgi:predicted ATPase with chaperone activity